MKTKLNHFARLLWRSLLFFELVLFFFKELVVANLQVALAVIRPLSRLHPAIITVPLDLKSETGAVFLANMITLTPGTLSLELYEGRPAILVHVLNAQDPEQVISDIKSGFEKRLMRIFD